MRLNRSMHPSMHHQVMPASTDGFRILLFDPDPHSRLEDDATSSQRPLNIVRTPDATATQEALANGNFDGVVMALDIDEDAAFGVVGEMEHHCEGVPLFCAVSGVDDETIARACHLGAAGLLVRPYSTSNIHHLLATPVPDAGFAGACVGVPTALLLTLHCTAGADGILHLRCDGTQAREERTGSIFLEGGQPVHAIAGNLAGSDAVHAMLSWIDAEASWLPGQARCARTIVGRWEGLLARSRSDRQLDDAESIERLVAVAYPDVVEKLSRLAQTPDVLGAFLLRHAEIITGRCATVLDEQLASRALCRLAHVFFDVEAQPNEESGREVQAVIGDLRLVLDRIGPVEAGFQVGVIVRQAAPVCKSLRRLLRQIDTAFTRALRSPGTSDRMHNNGAVQEVA